MASQNNLDKDIIPMGKAITIIVSVIIVSMIVVVGVFFALLTLNNQEKKTTVATNEIISSPKNDVQQDNEVTEDDLHYGTKTYSDGTILEGYFDKNKYLVRGKIVYDDGLTLEGKFFGKSSLSDLVNGTAIYPDGTIVKADFDESLFWNTPIGEYKCTVIGQNEIREGVFHADVISLALREGKYTNTRNGIILEGKFDSSHLYLLDGTATFPDGTIVEADFDKNLRQGTIVHPNIGTIMIGKFSDSNYFLKSGIWVEYLDGSIITREGDFIRDYLVNGTATFPDGTITKADINLSKGYTDTLIGEGIAIGKKGEICEGSFTGTLTKGTIKYLNGNVEKVDVHASARDIREKEAKIERENKEYIDGLIRDGKAVKISDDTLKIIRRLQGQEYEFGN